MRRPRSGASTRAGRFKLDRAAEVVDEDFGVDKEVSESRERPNRFAIGWSGVAT